ncbi:hypothetical protein PORY_000988 [Pneumocystis oryctolagi]|uniref:Uncharacterized protein n=1 Tax=Pneumocystis oryctolagi TaxID=42067 RepID=A0ACB7CCG3_9ASCO|nr:hypothetical protein PORY_000988 [Pneumocystis oryctolagi]
MVLKVSLCDESPKSRLIVSHIANVVRKSKKSIIITSAGIFSDPETSEFRSTDGLYRFIEKRCANIMTKVEDMVNSLMFQDHIPSSIVYSLMEELQTLILSAKARNSDKFFQILKDRSSLLQFYTRNINNLKAQEELYSKNTKKNNVTEMYNDVHKLKCAICGAKCDHTAEKIGLLKNSSEPNCSECLNKNKKKLLNEKKALKTKNLQQNVVFYDETRPINDFLAQVTADIKKRPDLLLIIGISLRLAIRSLIKDISKIVHSNGGKVIFINHIEPPYNEWKNIIDWYVEADCNQWIEDLKKRNSMFMYQSRFPGISFKKKKKIYAEKHSKKYGKSVPIVSEFSDSSPPLVFNKTYIDYGAKNFQKKVTSNTCRINFSVPPPKMAPLVVKDKIHEIVIFFIFHKVNRLSSFYLKKDHLKFLSQIINKNMSFEEKLSKIRTQYSSKNDYQKQISAVLLAIEDTLHNENVEGNVVAYFGSLLSLLEKSLLDINNKGLLYSILYLLNLVIPFTNKSLLRIKYDKISILLGKVFANSELDTSILRLSISCLQHFLIIQENSTWTNPNNNIKSLFSCLVILGIDSRPKVRKKAHDAIGKILSHPPPSPLIIHPILDFVSKEILNISKRAIFEFKENTKHKNKTFDHSKTIHTFQLLKVIVNTGGWPSSKIEQLCDILMEVSETKDYYLIAIAFEVFQIIFKKLEFVSEKLRGILDLILKKKPSEKDAVLLPLWFSVLITGFESYSKLEEDSAFTLLQVIFIDIFPSLQSNSLEIRTSCSKVLIRLITNCIPSYIGENNEAVINLSKTTMQGFTLSYRIAWKEIFEILIAFFERLPFYIDPYFIDALKLIDKMRTKESFDGKLQADQVIGAAIKAIGPRTILEILPLDFNLESEKQPTRIWMLTTLRSNICNTELQHFISEFIPLSKQLYEKIIKNENPVEKKTLEAYIEQIWALFPSYCKFPIDIKTAFSEDFVELLTTILYNQTDLRPIICQALQILINKNKEIVDDNNNNEKSRVKSYITKLDAERNLAHLQKFAPTILSILFDIYSQTLSQFREYILTCIKSWLSITSKEEIENIFNRVTELLSQSLKEKQKEGSDKEKIASTSHAILDILIIITIYLPFDASLPLYNIVNSQISDETDHILQKKAYNLFCKMVENPSIKIFLEDNIQELQKIFLENAFKTTTSIKKYRFSALFHIINILPSTDLHFIPLILSEVIIGTKDSNKKARYMAYNLLILMGNKMSKGGIIENSKIPEVDTTSNLNANIQEFFTMVSAGLAGSSPHMISATIVSITRLLFEFKDSLNPDFINQLLSTVYMYIASNNHEIAKSALGFVKMTVVCLPVSIMQNRLPILIPNLMVWIHEHKGHFKAKVKNIIERMIRRYGFEIVEKEVPDQDKKLLTNIRKTKERLKRRKIARENKSKESTLNHEHNILDKNHKIYKDNDDDSDISIFTDSSEFKDKKATEKQTIIKKIDDELIDLLDTNSLVHVVTTNSKNQKKTKEKNQSIHSQFKVDSRGKIIIDDYDKIHDSKKSSKSSSDNFNAYLSSIKNKDNFSRGQSNKIRFSNKRKKQSDDDSTDTENNIKTKRHVNNQNTKNTQNFKHIKNKHKIVRFR